MSTTASATKKSTTKKSAAATPKGAKGKGTAAAAAKATAIAQGRTKHDEVKAPATPSAPAWAMKASVSARVMRGKDAAKVHPGTRPALAQKLAQRAGVAEGSTAPQAQAALKAHYEGSTMAQLASVAAGEKGAGADCPGLGTLRSDATALGATRASVAALAHALGKGGTK